MIEFSVLPYNKRYDICELNKKLIDKWFHYDENTILNEASWEELSVRERFLHGGPWNDLQPLNIHLDSFEKFGEVIIAIDTLKDEIIGEIEYHKFGKIIHIDWMMVCPDKQKQGIGTQLINYIANKEKERGYNEIWTEPEIGVENFYISNGFEPIQPKINNLYTNGSSTTDVSNWKNESPEFMSYYIGDATNTLLYSKFLLETEIKYAKIFDKPNPVSWNIIQYEDQDCVIIRRKISVFNNRSKLIITTNQPINDLSSIFNKAASLYRENEEIFTTMTGITLLNWTIHNKITKLRKYIY